MDLRLLTVLKGLEMLRFLSKLALLLRMMLQIKWDDMMSFS